MLIVLVYLLLICLILLFIYILYAYFLNKGAVYYPSTKEAAVKMLNLAKVTKKDTIIDFGSGDGVVVIETAKMGIKAIGYELDPILVLESRKKIKDLGLENLAEIRLKNMYEADVNEGTILYFYQFPQYMDRFEKILNKKLTHPVKVVSNRYQFSKRKPDKQMDKIYLYKFIAF